MFGAGHCQKLHILTCYLVLHSLFLHYFLPIIYYLNPSLQILWVLHSRSTPTYSPQPVSGVWIHLSCPMAVDLWEDLAVGVFGALSMQPWYRGIMKWPGAWGSYYTQGQQQPLVAATAVTRGLQQQLFFSASPHPAGQHPRWLPWPPLVMSWKWQQPGPSTHPPTSDLSWIILSTTWKDCWPQCSGMDFVVFASTLCNITGS